MKRHRFRILLICLAAVIFAHPVYSQHDSSTELKLAHNDSLGLPLRWIENGRYTGPMIEIMHELSRRSGITFRFYPQPFSRTWAMIRQGSQLDGGFGNYHAPEREQFADYFYPAIGFYYNRLYTSSDIEPVPQSMSDITGKSIVTLAQHSISLEFDQALASGNIQRIPVNSYDSMIEMLKMQRAYYAAAPQHIFDQLIQKKGYEQDIVKTPLLFAERGLYFYLSKQADIPNREQVMERLSNALTDMERDGFLETIHQQFGTRYKRAELLESE
ncbi:substrate-binding periplasmic protein [Bacterioplanoides sp.]|uniref:substrate-binding periplasmic protein n=1 Tax=Bacterioplanoides sp. TaxID=2066072 RepID=UPI003B00A19A